MTTSADLPDLLQGGWRDLAFEPFREGVEVCYLTSAPGPVWALLRYAPGASVPLHRHPALETILVLEGSQTDEYGTYHAGSFVLNAPESVHSVRSADGCVVLIQWQAPVVLCGTDLTSDQDDLRSG